MISRIKNNVSFKSAVFQKPQKITRDNNGDKLRSELQNKNQISIFENLEEKIDTISEKYGYDIVAKPYVDNFTGTKGDKYTTYDIIYKVFDKTTKEELAQKHSWVNAKNDTNEIVLEIEKTLSELN